MRSTPTRSTWTRRSSVGTTATSRAASDLRDRVTFAMIVGIPIIQMALFGYAINTDPKHLDTAIISGDNSNITRSFISAMRNSSYFKVVSELPNEAAGREALDQGKVLFVVNIPAGFTRQLLRHERPALLIEADG